MAPRYSLIVEDVVYAAPDGHRLHARLYRPQGKGPFPGVVEVHGGAWTANTRLTNTPINQPLAESGVVVMAIDFRMPPDAQYPASLADINLAVRWLKANAAKYAVDPAKVGLLGTSSGGHQAMLAAMRPHDPRYMTHPLSAAADVDASVPYIAICWAIVDPHTRYRMAKDKGIDRLVAAHHAYWPDEAAMAEGSPQGILERGEAAELPPALAIQGTEDGNMTPDMADRFAEAYRAAGGQMRLEKFPGAPHAFVGADPSSADSRRAIQLIIDFVHEQTDG